MSRFVDFIEEFPKWWTSGNPLNVSYPELTGRDALSVSDMDKRWEISASLNLGKKPIDVSPAGLTSKEAHIWLKHGAPDGFFWLVENSPGAKYLDREIYIDTIEIARWLSSVLLDPKRRELLLKEREIRGPYGELLVIRFIDRIDELRNEDIVRGPKTSVDDVFNRASERLTKDALERMKEMHEKLADDPKWWVNIPFVHILNTPSKLVEEGKIMRHCVGQYAGYVKNKESVVASIVVRGERSTVEFDYRTGRVKQHMSYNNEAPSALSERALLAFRRKAKVI